MPGALEVARVRRGLRGVHRKAGESALLGALDLAVPVGALDQAHRHPSPAVACQGCDPAEDQRRAAAVGLHREAEPVPGACRRIPRQRLHDRSEEHTSELQSPCNLVCRLLLEKKNKMYNTATIEIMSIHIT